MAVTDAEPGKRGITRKISAALSCAGIAGRKCRRLPMLHMVSRCKDRGWSKDGGGAKTGACTRTGSGIQTKTDMEAKRGMKTMQYYLRQADRESVLDSLAYDLLCDPTALLERKDRTVGEIQTVYNRYCHYRERMQILESLYGPEWRSGLQVIIKDHAGDVKNGHKRK